MTTQTPRPALIDTLDKASTRRTTPVGDGELVWRIWGNGEPLVLLHGGTGSWMHWMRNVEDLVARLHAAGAGHPGLGRIREPGAADQRREGRRGAAAPASMRSSGRRRRFAIAGFSMGGLISGYRRQARRRARRHCLVLVGADRHHRRGARRWSR